MVAKPPAQTFNFNTFEEIKSHSAILYNERMAILFYLLDMRSIQMNTNFEINDMLEVRAILKQIYKNIRMLLSNTPALRNCLHLESGHNGVYVTDIMMGMINRKIEWCQNYGYTEKKIYVIAQNLDELDMTIKRVLQYFQYFIRAEFAQKPDIDMATEKYKEMIDNKTIDQLRSIAGKNALIDFDSMGIEDVNPDEDMDEDDELFDEDVDLDDVDIGDDAE